MHYVVLLVLDGQESSDEVIEEAMASSEGSLWDWWQVGGRWTGLFDGYDPNEDPKNIKTCEHCHGTGKRTDMEAPEGCNGCRGTGKSVEWPTQWGRHEGDIMPISQLTEEHHKSFYAVVIEGWGHWQREAYIPWAEGDSKFVESPLPPLKWIKKQYPNGLAVVIDCHN